MERSLCDHTRRLAAIQDYSTFPTEILCEIFLLATDGDCLQSHRIARVCARWREIVLSYPRLWYHHTFEDPMCVPALNLISRAYYFFDHARGAPISMSISYPRQEPPPPYPPSPNPAVSMLIASHLAHTVDLSVAVSHGACEAPEQLLFLHAPAPLLRRAHIALPGPDILLSSLFADDAPRLAQLTMRECRLPWAQGQYVNLTQLSISILHEREIIPTHADDSDVMHVFRDSPNLTVVEIKDDDLAHSLPELRDGNPHPAATGHTLIPLPKLRRLVLNVHPTHLTYILTRIATPPDLTLQWCATYIMVHVDMRFPLLPRDPACLPLLGCLRRLDVTMRDGDTEEFFVTGSPIVSSTHPRHGLQPADDSETLVLFFPTVSVSALEHFMLTLEHCCYEYLFALRELRLAYYLEPESAEDIVALFRALPAVERLSLLLCNTTQSQTTRWLAWPSLMAECVTPGGLFPALQHLTIRETIISEDVVRFLRVWLPRLRELHTVHLDKCRFVSEDVWTRLRDDFQQHVDEVLITSPLHILDPLYGEATGHVLDES